MFTPESRLGTYRLIERIGAGGMGEVWKAEDTRLGRMVAIKILPPAVAADAEAIARMRREARTAAQLNHPNIATIYAFEESDGQRFIAMELVEGEPLTKRIERGALPEAEVCRIGRAVADAIAEAHARGVVHRDIKPDNIMVGGSRVKVLDFGIAKQVEVVAGSGDPTAPLTQQGMIIGTIHYMSPEQALGRKLGRATDIFSLGVVLYQAATGKLPFLGESITETLTLIIRDDPPPPTGVSAGLAALIERCLRKNPDERFAAGDLAAELDAQRGGAPTVITGAKAMTVKDVPVRRQRRWGIPAGMFAVIVGVLVAMGVLRREEPVVKPAAVATSTVATSIVAPAPASTTVEVAQPVVTATVPPAVIANATATTAAGEGARRHTEPPPVASVPPATKDPEPEPEPPTPKAPEVSASERVARGEELLLARDPQAARVEFGRAMETPGSLTPKERAIAQFGIAFANGNQRRAFAIIETLRREFPGDERILRLRRLMEEQRPPRGRQRPMRRP